MSQPEIKPIQRRLTFLLICLLGYGALLFTWWMNQRQTHGTANLPNVTLHIEPFKAATPEVQGPATALSAKLPESFSKVVALKVVPNADATATLGGSVVGEPGGKTRFTAVLTDGKTHEQFWSKNYDASPDDPQPIAKEILNDALAALRERLRPHAG